MPKTKIVLYSAELVEELARKLGISRRWLEKLCRQTFERPLPSLLRLAWVNQAIYLMQHTHFDNSDIAMKLHYSEVSSLARDFRKTLRCGPDEARKLLIRQSREELLKSALRPSPPKK